MKTTLSLLVIALLTYSSALHAEEENSAAKIGPDKGIVEAKEELGIKLSPEAAKNFEIKTLKLAGTSPWTVPQIARVTAGEESSFYRLRDGFFKRISFETIQKNNSSLRIRSDFLKPGDEIVIQGTGFLRISELAAFGEASEEKGK